MPTMKMPQAGKNMSSATVRRWRKAEGEAVAAGEVLVEVESEDGLIEIQAPAAGTLAQILLPAGKTGGIGAPLAVLGDGPAAAVQAVVQASVPRKDGNGDSMQAPKTAAPAGNAGNVVPIVMPQAGQSMEEGTIVKWHVKPGDMIQKGQVIFEVETDKATVDVEATDGGRVARIILAEGGTCAVKLPVAFIAENDADVDAYLAAQGEPNVAAAAAPAEAEASAPAAGDAAGVSAPMSDGGRVKASPAARNLAAQRGIDLAGVGAGSGPGGRILSTDVPMKAARAAGAPAAAAAAPATPGGVGITPLAPVAPVEGEVRKRMSPMRKAIARNLLASKQNIPHFYLRLTVNADPMYGFYQGEKAKYPCSLNDVVALSCAKLVMEFPAFRSRMDRDEIVELPRANIGIAVGMDEGLVVPVLVGADQMSLKQLAAETKRIATAARGGKIEGMGQGVFTITNLGMFGVEEFSGIINPPEAAILAVGAMREEVIVSGGTMRPGRVMTMTLSCDHRIIDGMLAAKFMARLKEMLEYPQQLVQ